ncbi:MAG: glycosyltransferase family 4 protein [Chloroflexota bacterium]
MAPTAFVSTYPPRHCGIATFTADLGRALGGREIVALRRPDDHSRLLSEVHHVIRTDLRADYARVARSLGDCGVRVVSVQHEFGIWGGDDGENVLDFLAALSVPAVATLHTVLEQPTIGQRRVMEGILESTAAVVVMSQTAAAILAERYGADPTTVEVIPHGVPDLPFTDPDTVKPMIGLEGRRVLLSFGLVGPSKGYEWMIEAMPAIVDIVPTACYVILGVTHPGLLRTEGERYRRRLEALTAELGMNDHVFLVDRFVERSELSKWLEAADVFVTPYPNLQQIVSGTLSYAMAAGKPSVSTPYLYASEILAGGRGMLVPPRSSVALTDALVELLLHDSVRAAMAARAYEKGRGMVWSRVAATYERLFARLQSMPRDLAVLAAPASLAQIA